MRALATLLAFSIFTQTTSWSVMHQVFSDDERLAVITGSQAHPSPEVEVELTMIAPFSVDREPLVFPIPQQVVQTLEYAALALSSPGHEESKYTTTSDMPKRGARMDHMCLFSFLFLQFLIALMFGAVCHSRQNREIVDAPASKLSHVNVPPIVIEPHNLSKK